MKLSSILLRDKIPELHKVFLTAETDDLELSYEAGLVSLVRRKFPDEPPHLIPLSNILRMRPLPLDEVILTEDEPKRRGRPPKNAEA